jgi:hypothetical protein
MMRVEADVTRRRLLNARKPNRVPNAIVLAEDVKDVIAAVKPAKARGWQVSTRSGPETGSSAPLRPLGPGSSY